VIFYSNLPNSSGFYGIPRKSLESDYESGGYRFESCRVYH